LDSLTTQELARIADSRGIDIPPNLDRIFIIEELMDYARAEAEDREGDEDAIIELADPLETSPIPRQYNITFIEVMIRDPLWAYVFWEIKEHDRNMFERDPNFSGYYLRVNPMAQDGSVFADQSFTVQVDNTDSARYLGLQEQGGGRFQVALCAGLGEKSETLASSRIFCLPKLPAQAVFERESGESPLSVLSGSEDFRVLRNADRQTRLRFLSGKSG
jgi:hypothetical protein